MNKRIRFLRESLKMSRVAFGQKIGVSGDVVNNLERGRVDVKDHIIKLIVSEFNVNEDWLINGVGSMFIEPDTFSLDDFIRTRGATRLELDILKAYFEIDSETRKRILNHFKYSINHHPETPEELEAEFPPVGESGSNVG